MNRNAVALLTVAVFVCTSQLFAQERRVDLVIRGGTVVDGTGAPARRADVGISADRIVFVGLADASHIVGRRTVDATGLIVAPGFIDPHSHTLDDLSSRARRSNVGYLMQGVTTVVTNNDGGGTIEIGQRLHAWAMDSIGTNAALYVPQGAVRGAVLGMSDATPTPAQLDSMRAIVARGMREGAIGMSTGLYYAPGSYAPTEEVIELAKVAARYNGIYDSHMRDEGSYTPTGVVGSVQETIRIAREAHLPVHISHIKALGTDVWGQSDSIVAIIKAARAEGLDVTADQYPYLASGTSVGASLLPRWAEVGGRDALRARVTSATIRPRLVSEMVRNLVRRGGASSLLISATRDTSILGRTLEQVAGARHEAPIQAALQIILAGDASVASFNMKESDLETFMVQPFVMTGSDGSSGHPRKFGTFSRKLREFVYGKPLLSLPQAVRSSSGLTAETLRIADRGVLAEGKFADVIVFDSATVRDRATYQQPTLLATGMRYVLVNGVVAVSEGTYTGALAGRPLRRREP